MFKRKKTPDYLKFILIIATIFFIGLGLLATFTNPPKKITENNNEIIEDLIKNINNSREIESTNLISYIKQNTITEPIIYEDSPILGNGNEPITIFQFSCYGCPASKDTQPILEQIIEDYPNKIKLVWKDLPIQEIYPEAELAHIAARCAQKQGKFWEYHNELWNNQESLSFENLINIGKKIGLDENKLEECTINRETVEIINKDIEESSQLFISGTPHFYINSQEIFGSASIEDFKRIIDIELNR